MALKKKDKDMLKGVGVTFAFATFATSTFMGWVAQAKRFLGQG